MVVAGHVVPLSFFMPDHHHAILSRLEETVWLVWPPVVKLLWKNMFSFHAWVLGCWSQVIKIRLQLQQHGCLDKWESFWWEKDFFSKLRLQFPRPTEDGANVTPRGKQTLRKPTNKMLQFVLKQDNRKQTKTLIFQCFHGNVHKTWGTAHPSKGVPLFWKITHYISSLSPGSGFWHASASRRITAFTCFNSWSLPAGALYVWECVIASEKQMQRRVCRTGAASHAEMCHEGDTSSQRLVIVKP